eukprot:16918-Prorocentrum_minimum.AAC.1
MCFEGALKTLRSPPRVRRQTLRYLASGVRRSVTTRPRPLPDDKRLLFRDALVGRVEKITHPRLRTCDGAPELCRRVRIAPLQTLDARLAGCLCLEEHK